jgi:hypothetical protein
VIQKFFVPILLFIFLLLPSFAYFLLFNSPVSAHLLGQPPFFKVNGVYSIFYSVQSYSAYGDTLPPQDFSPGRYVVNEPVSFELEKSQLTTIIPSEIVEKTKFVWDFGDGTKGTGFTNSHSYAKQGSYILTIYADTTGFEKGVEPQLLQSVFFDILPDKNYQTPTAVIKVNGNVIEKDATTNVTQDVFAVNIKHPITFDASDSSARSSKIVKYIWDFGDGEKAEGITVAHTYTKSFDFISPSLRVVDERGFLSEVSVGLKTGEDDTAPQSTGKQSQSESQSQKYIAIALAALFSGLGIFLVLQTKRR